MFERPEITDQMVHPWEDQIVSDNERQSKEIVPNGWGHITGLVSMGDSLYLSVGAKQCLERYKKVGAYPFLSN